MKLPSHWPVRKVSCVFCCLESLSFLPQRNSRLEGLHVLLSLSCSCKTSWKSHFSKWARRPGCGSFCGVIRGKGPMRTHESSVSAKDAGHWDICAASSRSSVPSTTRYSNATESNWFRSLMNSSKESSPFIHHADDSKSKPWKLFITGSEDKVSTLSILNTDKWEVGF